MSYSACDFVDDICQCLEGHKLADFDQGEDEDGYLREWDQQEAAGVALTAIENVVKQRDDLAAALQKVVDANVEVLLPAPSMKWLGEVQNLLTQIKAK